MYSHRLELGGSPADQQSNCSLHGFAIIGIEGDRKDTTFFYLLQGSRALALFQTVTMHG